MSPLLWKGLGLVCVATLGAAGPGQLKFTTKKIDKARKDYWSFTESLPKFASKDAVPQLANRAMAEYSSGMVKDWLTTEVKGMTEKPSAPWEEDLVGTVITAYPQIISIEVNRYKSENYAHPYIDFTEFNFGIFHGRAKQLKLVDLFKPGSNPLPFVSKYVIAKLKAKGASSVTSGFIKSLDKTACEEFSIKRDRLTYTFSADEMGSHPEGSYEVDVPYSVLAKKLNAFGPLKPFLSSR